MDYHLTKSGREINVAVDISDCFETLAIDLHHGETMYRDEDGEILAPDDQEPLVHFEVSTACCQSRIEMLSSPAQLAQIAANLVTKLSKTHTELMLAFLDFAAWQDDAPPDSHPEIIIALFSAGNPSFQMTDSDRLGLYDQLIEEVNEGHESVLNTLRHAGISGEITRETLDKGVLDLWMRWKHVVDAIWSQTVTDGVRALHNKVVDGEEDPHGE